MRPIGGAVDAIHFTLRFYVGGTLHEMTLRAASLLDAERRVMRIWPNADIRSAGPSEHTRTLTCSR